MHCGNHQHFALPTDHDGDGKEDLLVGAEDGKVYYLYRSQAQAGQGRRVDQTLMQGKRK